MFAIAIILMDILTDTPGKMSLLETISIVLIFFLAVAAGYGLSLFYDKDFWK